MHKDNFSVAYNRLMARTMAFSARVVVRDGMEKALRDANSVSRTIMHESDDEEFVKYVIVFQFHDFHRGERR